MENNFVPKKCGICGGGLKPIGDARKNGKNIKEWKTRVYHKKCYLENGPVVIVEEHLENIRIETSHIMK